MHFLIVCNLTTGKELLILEDPINWISPIEFWEFQLNSFGLYTTSIRSYRVSGFTHRLHGNEVFVVLATSLFWDKFFLGLNRLCDQCSEFLRISTSVVWVLVWNAVVLVWKAVVLALKSLYSSRNLPRDSTN
jgi:hypothetical protein